MKKLIVFFLPLMASGILQLLFNAVDLVVVGRFTGSEALAAVGSTTALISMLVNLFIGISNGVNVMTARYYAMKDRQMVHDTVHTAILFAMVSGFAMIAVGFLFSRPALTLMGTPDTIIDQSLLYMRIYFCGMPFFMTYNYGAAILRAAGDTVRPLRFLVIAGITNALLNLLLVTQFHLGVAGVAVATVVSQCISCVLVLRCLMATDEVYRLNLRELRIRGGLLVRILRIGVPAGLQSVIINFSNVLLQSTVNTFGSDAMAGYTAANNLFGFQFASIDAISQACMSFTSQNLGRRKMHRMDRVLRNCLLLDVIVGGILGVLCTVFGRQLIGIYTSSAEVIRYGMMILPIASLPYLLCGIMNCIPGAMRGMGYSTVPMFLSLIGTVGTRIVWIYLFFPMQPTLTFLFVSYPLSWAVTIALQLVCYFIVRHRVYRKLGPEE